MKHYTMTATLEGEAYHYMDQFNSISEAVEKMEEVVLESWCESNEVEIDLDDAPAITIISVVVTAEKPERFGEYY